jgi:poly-gamma-glutamate synthase PgsB/CapB
MAGFIIILVLSFLFLTFLAAESIFYNRKLRSVPLRISVSGTRGKTSIVRTLASVYRAHGFRVLAKTTGSEAMFILPDGSTEPVRRKGMTTIIEQKNLIKKAIGLDADCIITEIMSIHPDNHRVETRQLIRPSLTILSNFRADHTDVAGGSLPEIAELFRNDIHPGSTVVIPEKEINEFIVNGIRKNGARLVTAPAGSSRELHLDDRISSVQFGANLEAVIAASRLQGIPDATIRQGICDTRLDIGQLGIFRKHLDGRKIWFVNAFAANDPVSTRQVIERTFHILDGETNSRPESMGLIALRPDRGERSHQWLDYLCTEGSDLFSQIYVSGIHSHIFTKKLKNCERLTSVDPETITRHIIETTSGDIVVFGIANIHGLGESLINHWKTFPSPESPTSELRILHPNL